MLTIGAFVVVAFVIVILVFIFLWIRNENEIDHSIFDLDSNVMLMYPFRHEDHPEFPYECRTIIGDNVIYKTTRHGDEQQSLTYTFSDGKISKTESDIFKFEFHEDFENIKNELWKIKVDYEILELQPHRMATTIGRKGFITMNEGEYMIGSYTYMDMTDLMSANFWLTHDFGNVPKLSYFQDRFHIRLNGKIGLQVYVVTDIKTKETLTYLICEQPNGSKIEIPNVTINYHENDNILIESINPALVINLHPKIVAPNKEVGLYKAIVRYKNEDIEGKCIREKYIP